MPNDPTTSAHTNEDVQLPAGPIVRIRALRPDDEPAVLSFLASPEAMRIGAAGGEEAGEHGTLAADLPLGRADHRSRRVGPALRFPRGSATHGLTELRALAGRVALARAARARRGRRPDRDARRQRRSGSDDFEHVLTAGFGAARRPDGSIEVASREWPAALAAREHRSDPFLGADDPQPATAPAMPSRMSKGRVVIVGGGVAALECLMALRDVAGPDLRIQLASADDAFTYRPLQVVEPFALGTPQRYPLSRVVGDFGAELVIDAVVEVRGEQRQAICRRAPCSTSMRSCWRRARGESPPMSMPSPSVRTPCMARCTSS